MTKRLTGWLTAQGVDLTTEIHDDGHEVQPREWTALAELFVKTPVHADV
ncbi:MAG: hypothetical protein AAF744_05780 [Pseudomonadota bacterium]